MHGFVHRWWAGGGGGDEEDCGKLIGKHELADGTGGKVRRWLRESGDGDRMAGWRWESGSSIGAVLSGPAHRLSPPGSWSPCASRWWWAEVNWPHRRRCRRHLLRWTPAGWECSGRWSSLWGDMRFIAVNISTCALTLSRCMFTRLKKILQMISGVTRHHMFELLLLQ